MPRPVVMDLIARDQFTATFIRAAAEVRALSKEVTATNRRMEEVGATGGARMGAGIAGAAKVAAVGVAIIGVASVKMAGDFQKSTNVFVTAAGESKKGLDTVRKGILDIAASTGTPWQKLVDGMYQVEKAGYRGADANKVLKAAAQGAAEEGANLATVTSGLTSVMASYRLKASDSVMVMNEMKTAAGESKTTFEDFSGSLNIILPIASANKISFADIAGSLASITQHGTTAFQAAQELANSMRNLAKPNAVAINMMGQLGISATDVSQRMGDGPGGRGFAGTLKYLSDVTIQHMGPAGLVLLDTLKRMPAAARDATDMLSKMAPATRALALQFLAGSISLRDYRDAYKSLPTDQAQLAAQFVVLENKARGYNSQIRQGLPSAITYTDAMGKMTGGMNGLNVALQLIGGPGGNLDSTNMRINAIAASAKGAGKDVNGWASTQGLFNIRMGELKQAVEGAGIKIGMVLLPALSTAAGWLGKFIGALTNNKVAVVAMATLIGVTLAGALAFYTVKLTIAVATTIAGMAKMAAAVVVNSAAYIAALLGMSLSWVRVGTAAETAAIRGLGARSAFGAVFTAIGTAASGMARVVGNAFRDAGASLAGIRTGMAAATGLGGRLGAIGTGIGGAALALGPLALGVVGVTAAVGLGLHAWESYKKKQAEVKQYVNDLTNAINQDKDALGEHTRALVAQKLESDGVYQAAQKLGLGIGEITNAALLSKPAINDLNAKLQDLRKTHPELYAEINKVYDALGNQNDAVVKATEKDKRLTEATKKTATATGDIATAFATASVATRTSAIATDRAAISTKGATDAAALQKHALDLLSGALDALNGNILTNMQSEDSFHSSLNRIAEQVHNNNTPTLIGFSDAAISNRAVIYEASKAILDHVDKMIKDKAAVKDIKKYLDDHKTALQNAAIAAGEDAGQVFNLTDKLLHVPKKVTSQIDADTAAANKKIADTKATLDFMAAHPYAVQVTATGDVLFHSPFGGTAKGAEGGVLPGWSPGHDNLVFFNPKFGTLHLSGGEGILRPEAVRAMGGAPAINSLNKAAKTGQFQAFNKVKSGRFRFSDGGIIELNVNFDIPQAIKDTAKAGPVSSVGPAGGPATVGGSLGAWINAALAITGSPASWFGPTLRRIMFESGGNPSAINLWDSNAQAGYPSQGLMQTIPQTFNAYHVAGTSNNITDPVANIAAALEYIKSRYGGYGPIDPPVQGYRRGAWDIARNQLGYLHRGEMVIPAEDATQIRAGRGSSGKTVNVYQTINPQAKQSELEIGAIAAARIGWASQVA